MKKIFKFLRYCITPHTLNVEFSSIKSIIPLKLNCPLCEKSEDYPFPKERSNCFGFHFKKGLTWMPSKGHRDFDLHKQLNYHKKSTETTGIV